MEYDQEEARRRRDYEKALANKKKLEDKLAELNRKARSAKSRLLASTNSEKWHRFSLAWLDRDAGYCGEMASARVWLRSQPILDYAELLAPFAQATPEASNIAIEVAAVLANLDEWTVKGDALLLVKAKRDYIKDVASFAQWEREHPDANGWRTKPSTKVQGFLIGRTVAALGVDPPGRMNRGEAHDWIAAHGGNRRLSDETSPVPSEPPMDSASAEFDPDMQVRS